MLIAEYWLQADDDADGWNFNNSIFFILRFSVLDL
jgi:hypothetical protein